MSYGEFIHEKNPKMRLGVLFYHMRTFNFFLPGVGKTQRNILEALVPFFLSFQIGIFLKSRLEIWHGHSSVQKTSFLLPFKQITNVLAYSSLRFFFSSSLTNLDRKAVTAKFHLLSPPVLSATATTATIMMLPQCWDFWNTGAGTVQLDRGTEKTKVMLSTPFRFSA